MKRMMVRPSFLTTKSCLSIMLLCNIFLCLSCCKEEEPIDNPLGLEVHDIVIVGGGIAGLTCGYYLESKDFVILEKSSRVGGRALSGTYNNVTYSKGAEYLGTPEGHLAQMIKGLALSLKEIPEPMDGYFDGSKFYYGSDAINGYLINNSSVNTFNRFVNLLLNNYDQYDDIPDLEYNGWASGLDHISARQWLLNNNIPQVYSDKYNVASRGLFGASLNEISALSFIPEAAFDYDETDIAYAPIVENRAVYDVSASQDEHSESFTFLKGLTELTDKLGERMKAKIKLNQEVVKIYFEGGAYHVDYKNSDGSTHTMLARKIVLAVPAPIALNIATDVISADKQAIMKEVEYSSYATAVLFSNVPIFNKAFDLAVPDGYFFTDLYDATWVQRYYDKSITPNTYIASVYIAPFAYTDHSLDRMTDAELLKKVYADLDKIFPGASSKVTGHDITHFPYAYPVMTPGAYERLVRLNDLNKGSLVLAGDYLIYPTFESAVESGYQAARRVK